MSKDDYYKAGKVLRVHGVKGELLLSLYEPELFRSYTFETFFVNPGGGLVPYFVNSFSFDADKNVLILSLEGIDDKASASAFVQREVSLQSSDLPQAGETQFFAHEVVGFIASDEEAGELGPIEEVLDLPMQQVFRITKNGREILIPAVKDILLQVNRDLKTVLLRTPPGLIDIYLSAPADEEE